MIRVTVRVPRGAFTTSLCVRSQADTCSRRRFSSLSVWVYVCMGIWVYGCMGVCVHRSVGAWVYGCVGVWVTLTYLGSRVVTRRRIFSSSLKAFPRLVRLSG